MLKVISNMMILVGFLSALYGYVNNVVELCTSNETVGKVAARVIGVLFFPLGCIIGWF